jgi:hypothetical protein
VNVTPDFSQLLAKLVDTGFEFVIVGGYAAVAHGSAQVTRIVERLHLEFRALLISG